MSNKNNKKKNNNLCAQSSTNMLGDLNHHNPIATLSNLIFLFPIT